MRAQADTTDGFVVLIAEDYDDVRELYALNLRDAGFVVEETTNGAEAVRAVTAKRPHAVVIDLQMPEVDGFEAIRRIRALAGPRLYILALSAHIGRTERTAAFDAGCDECLAKPITGDALILLIQTALASSTA